MIGGSFAGVAAAARLAKLGHRVTLCERSDLIAGELAPVERDGFSWDRTEPSILLPAPLRDLFRKSGRPLERVAELVPVDSARRHLREGAGIDVPFTGRGAQMSAFDVAVGPAAAAAWTRLVDDYEPVWELLRTRVLETPFSGARSLGRRDRVTLRPRLSLAGRARALPDNLSRAVLTHYATMQGSAPERAPAFVGVLAYVERTFGRWRFPGGTGVLREALLRRLDERKVVVRTGAPVDAVTTNGRGVTGVRLAGGETLTADVVVSAIDARVLYGDLLADPPRTGIRRARPVPPRRVLRLGVREPLPDVPFETVLHRAPGVPAAVILRAPRDPAMAPAGHAAWTVVTQADPSFDPIAALARHGVDLAEQIVTRVDGEDVARGFQWRGSRTAGQRAPTRAGVDGLFCVGPTAHPGAGLAFEELGAASVAELVGKAPRVRAAGAT